MKKTLLVLVSTLLAIAAYQSQSPKSGTGTQIEASRRDARPAVEVPAGIEATETALERAIEGRAQDVAVEGTGTVIKLLRDDLNGSRHQKFLLRIPAGQVLLVAHNIDLAPRIDDLREGDQVEFSGEYVWNEKGGLIHWTHHDPAGRHPSGWLKHAGRDYR